MSRELKRVPLDFAWPLGTIWEGYLMPPELQPTECPDCAGTGYNPATRRIAEDFYDFAGTGRRWCDDVTQDEVDALVREGRLWDLTKTWTREGRWQTDPAKPHPTAARVNAWQRENNGLRGHDAVNRWILIETRARRLGVWGHCERCQGDGEIFASPEQRAAHDAWEKSDPPTGEGYQLWENVTEGSPRSPVFPTLDELAAWCAMHATTFADFRATAAEWKAMLEADNVHVRVGDAVFI